MIYAIIQARMGSSRLPNKVLLDLAGYPVLWHVVTRTSRARHIDKVIVATTDGRRDEVIRSFCREKGLSCFAGSEQDVLDRYYQAAIEIGAGPADSIVRITADCPLIDPAVIDEVIHAFQVSGDDYVSNAHPPSFPDGLDVEVFKFSMLQLAWREARLQSEREHVTPYFRNHPEKFSQSNVSLNQDLSYMRWTLDEPSDYVLLQRIMDALYEAFPEFSMADVIRVLSEHPEWQELNGFIPRNEGYAKSLQQDKQNNATIYLGTVQFGSQYGINNRKGRPTQEQVFSILDRALDAGITSLDTAAIYGEAEIVLGNYFRSRQVSGKFKVVSKLRPDFFDNNRRSECLLQSVVTELQASLERLGLNRIDGYLLHNADHLELMGIGEALSHCRDKGWVRQVGVSVYTPEQAQKAIQTSWVDAVQVPYNILDRRLDRVDFFDWCNHLGRPMTVFARSLLLQGLLMMTESEIPDHLASIIPTLRCLDTWLSGQGVNRLDAAFWFAARRPGIDAVVIGIDSLEQLNTYIDLNRRSVDFINVLHEGLTRFSDVDPRLLSPNLWESLQKGV